MLCTLGACTFNHDLVPATPRQVVLPQVTVSLERIEAGVENNVEVDVALESHGRPVTFDGLATQLDVEGVTAPATAAPTPMEAAAGTPNTARVIVGLYNAVAGEFERSIARCTAAPRCTARIRFELVDPTAIEHPADVALHFDTAVNGGTLTLPDLPLATRTDPPHTLRLERHFERIFVGHFGGGYARQGHGFGNGATSDLEIDLGGAYGPFGIVAVLAVGDPLMVGVDLRYAFERSGYAVIPFAGYGWYESPINSADPDHVEQGQGARLGVDFVARVSRTLFGVAAREFGVGGYAWIADARWPSGNALMVQAGLSVGFY